jgi:hypothetical protein
MKAKIIRDDIQVSGPIPDSLKDQVATKNVKRNGRMVDLPFWKVGAVLEHREAWLLVLSGCAEAADDECKAKVNRTPEQQKAAELAYSRIAAGIVPKDFEAFNAGYMVGYTPKGDWIPGPNYAEYVKQKEASENGAA